MEEFTVANAARQGTGYFVYRASWLTELRLAKFLVGLCLSLDLAIENGDFTAHQDGCIGKTSPQKTIQAA